MTELPFLNLCNACIAVEKDESIQKADQGQDATSEVARFLLGEFQAEL